MIALRIGPDMRVVVVGSPAYFGRRPPPIMPHDLIGHTCVTIRMATFGQLLSWEFRKGEQELNVRVDGQIIVNGSPQLINAALEGTGLAYVLEESVKELSIRGSGGRYSWIGARL